MEHLTKLFVFSILAIILILPLSYTFLTSTNLGKNPPPSDFRPSLVPIPIPTLGRISMTAVYGAADSSTSFNSGIPDTAPYAETTVSWDFGDGSEPSTGLTTTHIYETMGIFWTIVTATNPNGYNEVVRVPTIISSTTDIAPSVLKIITTPTTFNGADDVMTVSDASLPELDATTGFTITTNYKSILPTDTVAFHYLFSKPSGSVTITNIYVRFINASFNATYIWSYFKQTDTVNTGGTAYSVHQIVETDYHHYTVTVPPTLVSTYLDANLAQSVVPVGAVLYNNGDLKIGTTGGTNYAKDMFDQFYYYNYVLSTDQITAEKNGDDVTSTDVTVISYTPPSS